MRLIDADAFIQMMEEKCDHTKELDEWVLSVCRGGIKSMPTIQHWIPVTERLPETTDAVLTTYIVNGDRSRRYVEESSYYGNDESWSSPWDEYRIAGTRIEVIAWMPLPEYYKG